ncbi:MAG: HAD family hydrolase [Anaerolineae bacterium]
MTVRDPKVAAALPWERIAVVAVDLDGTLLRGDGSVSPRTVAALQRLGEVGKRLVVATGRRKESATTVLPPELRISGHVCNNGGDVRLNGSSIHTCTLSPEQAQTIVCYLEGRWPEGTFTMVVGEKFYTNRQLDPAWQGEVADLRQKACVPVAKLLVHLAPLEGTEAIHADLPEGCRMIVTGGGTWGEIVPDSISKAAGLALLLERWDLTLADAICFGDDMNDLEMVAECGIGVAMGNAAPEVKAVADLVAPTADEDGVAVVLEAFLDGKYGEGGERR